MNRMMMAMTAVALAVGCTSDRDFGARFRVRPTAGDATAAIQGEIDQA